MEELLGAYNNDHTFARFLARWPSIMADRIAQAAIAIGGIDGVEDVILAGSNGVGHPWPLSDIDLIPIYADAHQDEAVVRVDQVRRRVAYRAGRRPTSVHGA